MEVAFVLALVISLPALNVSVPSGAIHTIPSPLRIGRLLEQVVLQLAGKTKSASEITYFGTKLRYSSETPDSTQTLYCGKSQTLSETTIGSSMSLSGGFLPIFLTVAYVRLMVR